MLNEILRGKKKILDERERKLQNGRISKKKAVQVFGYLFVGKITY